MRRRVGIERGEQLIGGIDAGAGHRVEQGRLAGIGVADQGDQRQRAAFTRTARLGALHFDLVETLLQLLDARAEQATVDFELGLARTAQADRTAALALEMGPAAHQSRRQVLELGQFDLQLAFVRSRALGEDVENQSGAIDHPAFGELLEIALLHRTQGVVDQDQVGVERNLLLPSAPRPCRCRRNSADSGLFQPRIERADHAGTCRARQFGKLLQQCRIVLPGRLRLQQQGTFAFF